MASITKELVPENRFGVYNGFQEAAPPFDNALAKAQGFLNFLTQPDVHALIASDQILADETYELALCAQYLIYAKLVGTPFPAIGEDGEGLFPIVSMRRDCLTHF